MIYCGDSANILCKVQDKSVHLCLTSPPYDNLRTYNNNDYLSWDKFQSVVGHIYRVLTPGGVCVWVVGDASIKGSETGSSFKQALHFKDMGFRLHDTMIYMKKMSSFPSHGRYHQVFEYMFVFSKGRHRVFNPIKDRPNKYAGYRITGSERTRDGQMRSKHNHGKRLEKYGLRTNVWEMDNSNMKGTKDIEAHKHPARFPEALASGHILSWTNPGDTVLDPFMGSGTTGKMAILHRRKFIGIEISEEYCHIANTRINDVRLSMLD